MVDDKLPVGTKIRFLRDIIEGETVFRPAQIYAKEGELGEVVRQNELYGHSVKTYDSPKVFVASIGTEFEEVKEPISPEFADRQRWYNEGYNQALEDVKSNLAKLQEKR